MTKANAERAAAVFTQLFPSLKVDLIPGVAWNDHTVRLTNPAGGYQDITRFNINRAYSQGYSVLRCGAKRASITTD